MIGLAQHFIDGRWCRGGTERETIDPSTGAVASRYVAGTTNLVDEAVDAARRAFERGGWSNNPRRRAAVLLGMADRLAAARGDIAPVAVAESGKRAVEVQGEIDIAVSELRYYAGLARTIFGRVQEVGEGELSIFAREPIGVAAIIVPWNAPITLLVRSLAPALATGCTVVIKPAPQTALTNARVIAVLADTAELPPGVLNGVNEDGSIVGRALVAHADVDAISFTGSGETARHIMVSAAATMKRLNLELGGKAPALLFADADLDRAIEGIVRGATIAAGQQCTAITRILVESRLADEAGVRLAERFAALRIGPAGDARSEMGPVIGMASRDRLTALAAAHAGSAIHHGVLPEGLPAGGAYIAPSLIAIDELATPLVQEEHFGPVISFETFADDAEAVHKANATSFGLAASIWTSDAVRAQRVARAIKAGTVWLNAHNRLFAEAETGGYRMSGLGRLHGASGLDVFLETKHIFQAAPFLPSRISTAEDLHVRP